MSTEIKKIVVGPNPSTKFTSGEYYVLKGAKAGLNTYYAVCSGASDDKKAQIEILDSNKEISSCSNGDLSSFLWEWVPETAEVGYFRNVKTGLYLNVAGAGYEQTGLSAEKPSTWIGWAKPFRTLVAYSSHQPAEWITLCPSYHTLVASVFKMYVDKTKVGAATGCVDRQISAYPVTL